MQGSNSAGSISNWFLPSLVFLVLVLVLAPARAHHSFAMYDSTKTVTLRGTVKSFEWSNPHIVLWLSAEQSGIPPQLWSVELTSPANLKRQGWTRRSLQPGDKVVVELAPLRNGSHGGSLKRVTTASGVVLTNTSIVGVVRPAAPQRSSDPSRR